ncbi:nucleoside hydrolase [Roseomonas rosulenta]|uniref:nucleoside hydrolase n=1 Tax=Roseomonas rosulenta TaxID=2748667 RepID=UPI0034E2961F
MAWLLAPQLFTSRHVHVHVECSGVARGRTVVDRWERSGAPPNARLLETLDADGFFALLGELFSTLP